METRKKYYYFMIRPTGSENHQFLPKCCKYVGHTCNDLNIPQKSFRHAPKNKENDFVNSAKLGLFTDISNQYSIGETIILASIY